MSRRDKFAKNSTIKGAMVLSESDVFNEKDMASTPIPMLNVALSSKINGGLAAGTTVIAGESKHFKTAFALICAAAFQRENPDGWVVFYDSEFGSPPEYFSSFGIDPERVWHVPVTSIEQLRTDLSNQLEKTEKGEKVCIVVDSLGNLASNKEITDALEGNEKADMTRAKVIKSLFRIITPHLTLKDIPMLTINHVYKEMSLHGRNIVSGGTGAYYSADNIWIVGRRQDKADNEIKGYHFIINIEKSRYVREGAKIPISVTFRGGVAKWSGLLEVAEELGYARKPKVGWYEVLDAETGVVYGDKMFRAKELASSGDVWKELFTNTNFADAIHEHYKVSSGKAIEDEIGDEELEVEEA